MNRCAEMVQSMFGHVSGPRNLADAPTFNAAIFACIGHHRIKTRDPGHRTAARELDSPGPSVQHPHAGDRGDGRLLAETRLAVEAFHAALIRTQTAAR
ncbi:hypothetical protein [Tabrizicola thermarum]|uniref:hypothetical protein n=1 Tax=Tabrizicola thermarum TaxID=2670345 RepID=UPI0012D788FC|nr:hypothetical protein [Tabrizicola thermarum]